MTWKPTHFLVALSDQAAERDGYIYRGLGVYRVIRLPRNRKAVWSLVHLNTGHEVCKLWGGFKTAFKVATEIAECGDWDFVGLRGYENHDPAILHRMEAIVNRHPTIASHRDKTVPANEAVARQIAMERAS